MQIVGYYLDVRRKPKKMTTTMKEEIKNNFYELFINERIDE